MTAQIRKLTIGKHPKDEDAFHYVIGGVAKFYGDNGIVEGVVSRIIYREDMFYKNGIIKYEIWIDSVNPESQATDRRLWKELVFGTKDSYFHEYNLDY